MNNTGYSSITIDGEVIPLYFGLVADANFFMYLSKDDDDSMMSKQGDISPIGIGTLVYCGYINHCQTERIKSKYTVGHFTRHMDLCAIDEEAGEELKTAVLDWKNSKFSLRTLSLLKDNEGDKELKKNPRRVHT